jgi:hypothetical protein
VVTLSSSDTEEALELLSLSLAHGLSSRLSEGDAQEPRQALVVIYSRIGMQPMTWPWDLCCINCGNFEFPCIDARCPTWQMKISCW